MFRRMQERETSEQGLGQICVEVVMQVDGVGCVVVV
jgi:hypothetical protein